MVSILQIPEVQAKMSGGGMFGMGKSQQQASGWNQSDSSSNSTSLSTSSSASDQSVFNSDIITQLMQKAGMAANATIGAGDLAAASKQLFTGGSSFLDSLHSPDDAGTSYMNDRLNNNDVANQQIQQLQTDTGKLFSEQLNPQITADAVAGGNLGGGRQGVAQGMAMQTLADNFSRQATAIRAGDQSSKDAVASQIAQNSLTAANTGLGALPGLLSVESQGANANMDVYGKLAQIFGGPTTLTSSKSGSISASIADAISKAFGTTQSSGNAWNFQAAGQGGMG
jgi:hypothetical protein